MLASCEDALICDLAEKYHIYCMEDYPVTFIATLMTGLRDDSRTVQSLTGNNMTLLQTVEVLIYDVLNLIWWSKTKDGMMNVNRPKRLMDLLKHKEEQQKVVGFETEEDFFAAFNAIARE